MEKKKANHKQTSHCVVSAERKVKHSFTTLGQTCVGSSSGQAGLTSKMRCSGHRSAPGGQNGVLGSETFPCSVTHKSKGYQLRPDLWGAWLCPGGAGPSWQEMMLSRPSRQEMLSRPSQRAPRAGVMPTVCYQDC